MHTIAKRIGKTVGHEPHKPTGLTGRSVHLVKCSAHPTNRSMEANQPTVHLHTVYVGTLANVVQTQS